MSSQQSHGGEVEILERETDGDGMGLMSINAAEINQQIATAKRYPRSIKEFVETTEMVSMNQSIAAECMYSLKPRPRRGFESYRGAVGEWPRSSRRLG